HRDDVTGRPTDHLPSVMAHGEDVVGLTVERDHGRLVEDYAAALRVHEGVGRPQIDGEVSSQTAAPSARGPRAREQRPAGRGRTHPCPTPGKSAGHVAATARGCRARSTPAPR